MSPGESAVRPLALHRVRFVDWSPSSITALAFSPAPPASGGVAHQANTARSVLAVGRENGNIDLCTWCEDTTAGGSSTPALAKGWMVESTLFGDVNYKIEALAFTLARVDGVDRLRLFSTSGGSVLTEHFLAWSIACVSEGASAPTTTPTTPTRTLSSQGGAIWSLAASPLQQYLAIGCEDGIVRLVDVSGDTFEHVHGARVRAANGEVADAPRMARVASRILSLAWGPPRRYTPPARTDAADSESESEDDDAPQETWREGFLLGGLGNSTAAVWDVETGQLWSRLTVLKNRNEHTIVWSVAVLPDGTLVTGDSTGRVTFFDARTRVPLAGATFQGHTAGADVLSLCVASDGRAVYSGGVDQKVVEYTLVGSTWAATATRRLHVHDIRALAMDPPFSMQHAASGPVRVTRLPILVSGGIDFHLVLTPAASAQQGTAFTNAISSSTSTRFTDTTQRRIPFVPQNARAGIAGGAVLSVCAAKQWVVLRRDTSVAIWSMHTDTDVPWRKLSELELRTHSNLVAATVSPDGQFLAVSDLYETKLFALDENSTGLHPRRIKQLGAAIHGTDVPAPGASVLVFTPDSTRLVLGTIHGAYLHVVQLPSHGELRLLRSFVQHRQRAATDESRDGRALAGDARVRAAPPPPRSQRGSARDVVATLVLAVVSPDGQWLVSVDSARRMHVFHLDTLVHQRVLASPASLPTSLCFHPAQPHLLALTLPTNRVAVYDLDAGAHSHAWERALRLQLDAQLAKIREPVVGCSWLTGAAREDSTLVLYGPTWICTARHTPQPSVPSTRKRRGETAAEPVHEWHVRTTFKYQPLLSVDAWPSADGTPELLVVERPYFALAQSLPPSFYRGAKYGF